MQDRVLIKPNKTKSKTKKIWKKLRNTKKTK